MHSREKLGAKKTHRHIEEGSTSLYWRGSTSLVAALRGHWRGVQKLEGTIIAFTKLLIASASCQKTSPLRPKTPLLLELIVAWRKASAPGHRNPTPASSTPARLVRTSATPDHVKATCRGYTVNSPRGTGGAQNASSPCPIELLFGGASGGISPASSLCQGRLLHLGRRQLAYGRWQEAYHNCAHKEQEELAAQCPHLVQ